MARAKPVLTPATDEENRLQRGLRRLTGKTSGRQAVCELCGSRYSVGGRHPGSAYCQIHTARKEMKGRGLGPLDHATHRDICIAAGVPVVIANTGWGQQPPGTDSTAPYKGVYEATEQGWAPVWAIRLINQSKGMPASTRAKVISAAKRLGLTHKPDFFPVADAAKIHIKR